MGVQVYCTGGATGGDQLGSPVCSGLCLEQHQTVPRAAGAGLVRNSAQVGRVVGGGGRSMVGLGGSH